MKSNGATAKARQLLSNGTFIAVLLFVVFYLVYVNAAHNAFSLFTINNLMNNTVALAIAACGLTLVILIGGFDLSVGGVVVLANVIIASYGGKAIAGVLASLGIVIVIGAVVGAFNGFIVAYMGVQSIAATLATMIVCQGIALVIMPAPGGTVDSIISTGLTKLIGKTVPVALVILIGFALLWVLVRKTPFGVYLYAIGADEKASVQAGIPVRRVKFFSFLAAGIIYALAGFMYTAQTASGDPTGSTLFLLLVFAAVAIGGTSFGGGKGSVIGSILGAGILALLQKTLFAVGVSTFYTSIFQGVILIAAVLIGGLSLLLSKKGETA